MKKLMLFISAATLVFGLSGIGDAFQNNFDNGGANTSVIHYVDETIGSSYVNSLGSGGLEKSSGAFTTVKLARVDIPQRFSKGDVDFVDLKKVGLGNSSDSSVTGAAHSDPVPDSVTMLLIGAGLIGLAGFGRQKFVKIQPWAHSR